MVGYLVRSLGTLMLAALVVSTPALAVNKTVNGITADINLPQIQRGVPYLYQIAPIGPGVYAGPYTFTVLSSNLPSGITINSSGLVSGTTCSANGSYSPQSLRISDNNSTVADFTGNNSFSVNVTTAPANGCSVTVTATTAAATQGTPYSAQVTGSGTTGPYTYSLASGSLPAGVSIDPNSGAITGTPTTPGTYTFSILATDNSTSPASTGVGGPFTIMVAASSGVTISLSPATLPNGTNGIAYSQTVTASGGTAPYTYALSAGALPNGLTLNANGTLSGTPTTAGTFAFTVTGTDANGDFGARVYTVIVAPGNILALTPSTLPNGTAGTAYSQALAATGGTGPYTFAITNGTLPAGLTLNANGTLSGTPTTAGTYSFTVTGTDANGDFGTRAYTFTVAPGDILTVSPSTLPGGTVGTAYSQAISATGGTGPYTFAITAGSLPTGLTLNANGTLSGTPTTSGTFAFTVTGTDANGDFGSRSYSITVAAGNTLTVNPSTLPGGTAGTAYSQSITATGGVATYTFAITTGTLPTGLTLNASGTLSGTPTTPGTFTFTVTGTDANGDFGSRNYSVTIAAGNTLTVNPSTLPNATSGAAFSQTLTATGGTAPYTFSVTAGTLPTGLTLNANGTLSGTPTRAGTYTFSVRAVDANGNFGTRAYTVTVAPGDILTVNPATLPGGTSGAPYSQTVIATGGTGPYTYAVSTGTLPAGLTLNTSTGVISGTPTAAGTSNITVRATDANGDFGTRAYTLTIAGGDVLTIAPSALPNGTNGTAYHQVLTATGGTAPYTFSVTAGTLPTGLTLNANGTLSGTPTRAGTYTFSVRAVDANGDFGTRAYTMTIAGAQSVTVSPSTVPGGNEGSPYNLQFVSTGGTGAYTYSVAGGTIPPGLTLSAGGALTGTPTTPGTYTFTVRSVDANGNFGVIQITMVVGLSIRPDPTQNAGVIDGMTEQVGAARRAGELQMSHVMRRMAAPSHCAPEDDRTQEACGKPAGFWATGTSEQNDSLRGNASTSAVTVGVDTEVGGARVGAAIGTGKDKAAMASGFRNDADATSYLLYGRWSLQPALYVEGVVGRSSLAMDSRRRTPDAGLAFGQREGDATFASVGLAGQFTFGDLSLLPYARYETIRVELDGYTERSSSPLALQYAALKTRSASWVAGAQASYGVPFDWGRLTPSARIEFRDRSGDAIAQGLWYADRPGTVYVLQQPGVDQRAVMAALGVEAAFERFTVSFEYGSAGTALGDFDGQAVHLQIRANF